MRRLLYILLILPLLSYGQDLGRWTGGVKAQGNLPENWTAPTDLFDTQDRNDNSVYTVTNGTSTITLPSTIPCDGYLILGYFEYEDTSNGRLQPQGRFIQTGGTGNFVGAQTGSYNRDTSEDRSYVRTWAIIDNPSASATIQFQWKADTDDSTGGTVYSVLEIIPLYYSSIGMYTSITASLYGGTTPNQVTGFSAVYESNTSNINISSNTINLDAINKRYWAFGSFFREGAGNRTQRWAGFREDATKRDDMKAVAYYRNGSNDESGSMWSGIFDVEGTAIDVDMFSYRGDGVTAGQGGADVDGAVGSNHLYTMVFMELYDNAEVFYSRTTTGGIDLNVTSQVNHGVVETLDFNDSASFTSASTSAINVEADFDGFFSSNISAAQEVVGTTSRWTSSGFITVNGVTQQTTQHGDYARNNQGTIDTFGWSASPAGFLAVTTGDDVGVATQELTGGEDGGQFEVQAGWGGFYGINLSTLEETIAGNTGQIKYWNGSSWVVKPVKYWNGSSWETKPLKRWNGSSWVETNY